MSQGLWHTFGLYQEIELEYKWAIRKYAYQLCNACCDFESWVKEQHALYSDEAGILTDWPSVIQPQSF
jgi:hypothetical protein